MNSIFEINFVAGEIIVDDFTNEVWRRANRVSLNRYWSGAIAPPERAAAASLLWTKTALFARFDCRQSEPYVISANPRFDIETDKLWERDVCELFLAPNADEPHKYFEFEVAPTGEFLDYGIVQLADKRETDANYDSGIITAARRASDSFSIIFQIEWSAFGKKPAANDEWRGNLFRCVGAGATRGYLAWQPTLTDKPNFHVPAAFGVFKFAE